MPGQEQANAPVEGEHPTGPPAENPTARQSVHEWIAHRVAADEQMRWAGAARKAQERAQEQAQQQGDA